VAPLGLLAPSLAGRPAAGLPETGRQKIPAAQPTRP